MKGIIHKILSCVLLACLAFPAMAQSIITVRGKVLNLQDGDSKPLPFPVNEKVYIWAFNTVDGARDALKLIESRQGSFLNPDAETEAGSDGYYEIRVSETGALIFRIPELLKNEMYEIKYKDELNVVIESAKRMNTLIVVDKFKGVKVDEGDIEDFGDFIVVTNKIKIPEKTGASHRRLIMQPYLLDCTTEDTVSYLRPTIYNGPDYHLTQERRMGFDLKNDLLEPYFHKRELTEEAFDIIFNDTINKPDPQRTYHVTAKAIVTDYLNETYSGEWNLSPCRMREPLRFLEFSLPDFQLDPHKYIERPKLENRNTTGSISLTFLVNKAELDPQDPNNEAQMNKLRNDLMAVINGEGTTLKEFKIVGISSPEGRYDANMSLSKRRTRFASQQITSMIPAGRWSRVYKPTETRVATWNEVADLLEKDTLLTEAKEIREITEKYQSQDAQFAVIRKLPYYETIIKERLPRLRSVQYEYKYSILRELNPDEILDRYRNDPDYRNGKKQFTKYEYWQLFQMLKDTKEAEKIYKRAYEETMSYNSNGEKVPWILAANNWAVSLLKRDTFDVEILKPLIHPNRPVNYIDKFDDGVKIIETEINPEVIVANQMAMYLRAKQNKEAAILAQILPDTEKFRMLKAFSKCLRGFYNYRAAGSMQEIEERKKVFELVKNSSPMNHVIICMAMKTDQYNREAKRVLEEELPVNTLTKYLKVQLFIRESNLPSPKFVDSYSEEGIAYKKACTMLDEIIKEDPKYKKIIESDGEFSEEFIEFFNDPINWQY